MKHIFLPILLLLIAPSAARAQDTFDMDRDDRPVEGKVQPIEEKEQDDRTHRLTFLGNALQVRVPRDFRFTLGNVRENSIADAWQELSGKAFDNTLCDLLAIREKHQLCDWAYLLLLKDFSHSLLGKGSNEATLLTAWLYTQSGYMMRLARSEGRLHMLFGSRFTLFGKPYYVLDGQDYYELEESDSKKLSICNIQFPKERALSLYITQRQLVPQSDELYPALRKTIEGKTQAEALNMLLNFVQTSLTYEYDDKVWGGDRAFFPEETLHYPYADCEDRAILFTRLVRDLLQLRAALVYYPGHLAAAVRVTDPAIRGDYLSIGGERYLVCDPTFINAPIGRTMPGMDNSTAQAIPLD